MTGRWPRDQRRLPVSTLGMASAPDVAAPGCSPPPSVGVVTLGIGLDGDSGWPESRDRAATSTDS